MTATFHTYDHAVDFERISKFLTANYYDPKTPQNRHINWLQPRWEYMNFHPLIWEVNRERIGVWEDNGEIVGVAHPEHPESPTYFELRPGYESLKKEMLIYAEEHIDTAGEKHDGLYLMSDDDEFAEIARAAGYIRNEHTEPLSQVDTAQVPDSSPLPDGFQLASLADDNDLQKMHRVLHRGFHNGEEPPEDGMAERKFMQTAPNFRKYLTIAVVAPNGDWVSFCGMWYEPTNNYAMVEPVATDPDYRLRGFGKAAVVEGIRRCKELGAEVAYVGATLPIYLSIGFKQVYSLEKWSRNST